LQVISPLFVGDSHDVKEEILPSTDGKTRKHLSYRFFQVDGEDVIPGTSLRGMIRSEFEAVTNSCFGVFTPEARLDYRQVDLAKKMRAARVLRLPESKDELGEVALCKDARLPAYTDDAKIDPKGWETGEIGYTVVSDGDNPKVLEWVSKDRNVHSADERGVTDGWVKITGKTIDGKKNERFFFCPKGVEKAQKAYFDWERMQDYNAVLREQISDETRGFKSQYQHPKLSVGDLVYVRLSEDKKGRKVEDISLVKVPRLKFRKSLGDMIPSHLHPCQHYDELCPACRTFGWVKGAHQRGQLEAEDDERVAYASRVRFSHARLVEDKGVYDEEMTLAILSSPKPTTALFYLFNGNPDQDKAIPPEDDENAGYRDNYKLRGRKFYRHHGKQLNRLEFHRAGTIRDHQNRTVRGVRAPGNVFEFAIDFDNLAPVELGALLRTLDLGWHEQAFHRLGYAKPLGFGSVKITIEDVKVIDWKTRFQAIDNKVGWRTLPATQWGIAEFEEAMKTIYGKRFNDLENIRDLLAILTEPKTDIPIHYPRSDMHPSPEGKNFEWFEENTSGPNRALSIPEEDQGFPILKQEKTKSEDKK
jgi:CRISPR-associated protein (TIGR03986 family)